MAHIFQTYRKDGKPHPRWRFEYRDRFGRKRKGTGYTSKAQTLKLVREIEANERAIRKGYREAPKPTCQPRPFKVIAQEYLDWGDSQGGRGGRPWGTRHSHTRHRHLAWWQKRLSLSLLSDLEGCLPSVEAALRDLQKQNLAGRTVAQHAESVRAFCRWCLARDYLAEDPLRKLSTFDSTPLTTRRAMTSSEIENLLAVAPIERRFLYEVALCTGLRANELRNLTVNHFEVKRCGLRLDANWTKNRKAGFQPLPVDLVRRLVSFADSGIVSRKHDRYYVRNAPKNALLYIHFNPIRAFDEDLKAAGIPKKTAEGKLDFHALRVTYATLIIESGATVKEAQTLLRHSNPSLTMNVYAQVRPGRLNAVTEDIGKAVNNGHSPGLQASELIRAWEGLPEETKATILELVHSQKP